MPPETVIEVSAIGPDYAPQRLGGVAAVELDGEAVLYDENSASVHVLNPTAWLLWQCFDGGVALSELADEVSEAYGTDRDAVLADLLELARSMGRSGLLDGVVEAEPVG